VVGLMIWVVPGITEVFERQGQELPWTTQLLMAISDAVRAHAAALGICLLAASMLLAAAHRIQRVRRTWHSVQLRVPIVGGLIRAAESARAARSLALLISSAVPLLEAVALSARTLANLELRESLQSVARCVREGQSFSRALAQTGQFPPVATRLVVAGEKSGRLGDMLQEVSAHQEQLLETRLAIATSVLGPIVILFVGALVLFIVLAILMPIFDLNTLVR
jgi:general secretion pathway protein F